MESVLKKVRDLKIQHVDRGKVFGFFFQNLFHLIFWYMRHDDIKHNNIIIRHSLNFNLIWIIAI